MLVFGEKFDAPSFYSAVVRINGDGDLSLMWWDFTRAAAAQMALPRATGTCNTCICEKSFK